MTPATSHKTTLAPALYIHYGGRKSR
ncbi:hypothetical protein CCACVL1_18219 [Corchorus capsularis]|uniref:Uncharacterized protein n=1 Tax=Corchorus capsularis TaxID=210143 RepID=A0A1R3HM90_COCAP|nr:hypothetical protein CCACVL1_18219 [Corchorus capsularis]